MNSPIGTRSSLPWAGFGLAAFLCLYVVAYFFLCVPVVSLSGGVAASPRYSASRGYYLPFTVHAIPKYLVPSYRFGGHAAEVIFSPAQKLDERLFPDRWTFKPMTISGAGAYVGPLTPTSAP